MRLRALVVPIALAVVVGVTVVQAQETPRMGGVLKVASVGEPPTLDIPMSTAVIVTGAACWRADGSPVGLGGGYARAGIRFWPNARRI